VLGVCIDANIWDDVENTLGSAVATVPHIDAVLETASLRSPAFIDAEDMNIPRSGCLGERASPLHQASIASAERVAAAARQEENVGSGRCRRNRDKTSALCVRSSAFEQEFRAHAHRMFKLPIVGKTLSQRQYASSSAGSRLARPGKALPNPSIKPSPNSKPPGQRYSAVLHFLQRWPGGLPLVPAYVER
jgi:hypothetical protein